MLLHLVQLTANVNLLLFWRFVRVAGRFLRLSEVLFLTLLLRLRISSAVGFQLKTADIVGRF